MNDTDKKEIKLTAKQEAIVKELESLQDAALDARGERLSDKQFARHLGFSGSKWNLIKSRAYFSMVSNIDLVFHDLRRALNDYKNKKRQKDRYGDKEFITIDTFEAIFSAVEECVEKPLSDTARLIVYLAPTGGGKSFLGNQLSSRYSAYTIESREPWRNSHFVALTDICTNLDLRIEKKNTPAKLQTALLDECRKANPVLFIDEAEYFGPDIINTLKLLLNETRVVIIIGAIPEAYARWNQYWKMEADQLRRRTHLIVQHNPITSDVVEKFLAPLSLGEHAETAAEALAASANLFGAYDHVARVVDRLKKQRSDITPGRISNAIAIEHERVGITKPNTPTKKGSK
jgi:hypothetical protein